MSKLASLIILALLVTGCGKSNEGSTVNEPGAQATQAQPAKIDPVKLYTEAVALRDGVNGIQVDKAKAFELFNQAAELGDSGAMFFVGVMYENGESVPVDYQKATEWLEKSAKAGNGAAPERLEKLQAKMKKK